MYVCMYEMALCAVVLVFWVYFYMVRPCWPQLWCQQDLKVCACLYATWCWWVAGRSSRWLGCWSWATYSDVVLNAQPKKLLPMLAMFLIYFMYVWQTTCSYIILHIYTYIHTYIRTYMCETEKAYSIVIYSRGQKKRKMHISIISHHLSRCWRWLYEVIYVLLY